MIAVEKRGGGWPQLTSASQPHPAVGSPVTALHQLSTANGKRHQKNGQTAMEKTTRKKAYKTQVASSYLAFKIIRF